MRRALLALRLDRGETAELQRGGNAPGNRDIRRNTARPVNAAEFQTNTRHKPDDERSRQRRDDRRPDESAGRESAAADEIERLPRFSNLRGVQTQRVFRRFEMRPVGERYVHLNRAMNSLNIAIGRKRGSQRFVTGDEFLHGVAQNVGLQRPAQMEQPALVVNARRGFTHLRCEPEFPLRFRQRRERDGIRAGRVEAARPLPLCVTGGGVGAERLRSMCSASDPGGIFLEQLPERDMHSEVALHGNAGLREEQ